MTKTELIKKVAAKKGITQKMAAIAVDGIFDIISDEIAAGNNVVVPGFGAFGIKEREPRKGRNPYTNEAIDIPASATPSFKSSTKLKAKVKENYKG